MVGWYHGLNGHEFEQTPEDGEGQGSWHAAIHGIAESDMTERRNNKGGVSFEVQILFLR